MIKYSLKCVELDHSFEGWFKNSQDFDDQKSRNLISCPMCNSENVEKQLMAPSISTSERKQTIREELRKFKAYVDKNFENLGDKFTDEVIAIHEGKSEDRPITGTVTVSDRKKLAEAEAPYFIIPTIKDDA